MRYDEFPLRKHECLRRTNVILNSFRCESTGFHMKKYGARNAPGATVVLRVRRCTHGMVK